MEGLPTDHLTLRGWVSPLPNSVISIGSLALSLFSVIYNLSSYNLFRLHDKEPGKIKVFLFMMFNFLYTSTTFLVPMVLMTFVTVIEEQYNNNSSAFLFYCAFILPMQILAIAVLHICHRALTNLSRGNSICHNCCQGINPIKYFKSLKEIIKSGKLEANMLVNPLNFLFSEFAVKFTLSDIVNMRKLSALVCLILACMNIVCSFGIEDEINPKLNETSIFDEPKNFENVEISNNMQVEGLERNNKMDDFNFFSEDVLGTGKPKEQTDSFSPYNAENKTTYFPVFDKLSEDDMLRLRRTKLFARVCFYFSSATLVFIALEWLMCIFCTPMTKIYIFIFDIKEESTNDAEMGLVSATTV